MNIGREVGRGVEAVYGIIQNDSTLGDMDGFLFGITAPPSVRIIDRDRNLLEVGGSRCASCRRHATRRHQLAQAAVRIVVDTTGAFDDPTIPRPHPGIVARHLVAGAEQVIYSAAFKVKGGSAPEDWSP